MKGEVRVSSGTLRGRVVHTPAGQGTRPLLTRLRKSLADLLRPRLAGARILDLFGGSGAIAFELLSNGGKEAVLCELDPDAAAVIARNAAELGVAGRVRVLTGDALRLLSVLAGEGAAFDVIVVAPPYGRGLQESSVRALGEHSLLAPGGVVVVQRDVREPEPAETHTLRRTRVRPYGRTVFEFFEGAA
jgi:16S rRNA (guanine966-N2)-methyltransferase